MFELTPEQLQIILTLAGSPFGLVLIIQVLRHILKWRGIALTGKVIQAFVWVFALFLSYVWVLPTAPLPSLPACTLEAVNDCLVAIPGFLAALSVAIGYLYFAATKIYDALARPIFEFFGLGINGK